MATIDLHEELRMNFEELQRAIDEGRLFRIKSVINGMKAQDISDFLEEHVDEDVVATLFRLLEKDLAVEVFEHLEFEEQELLLNSLKHERVIEILEEMDPDDRTDLFEEMPAKVVSMYLQHLSSEERAVATKLLGYPDDSVGRLMTTEYISFRPHRTISEALARIKEVALDKETIYHCYVIDDTRKLIGYISLKMLLLAEPQQTLGEAMRPSVVSLRATQDQEDAARLFKHYDLLALPAVDSEQRLVGIVTFDDLVDVIEEETTEDIQRMAAIVPEEHPYFDTGFFTLAGKRIFWLSILLVMQVFSGLILEHYQFELVQLPALAFFIPLLMSTGGNAGTQSSAMIIRGLAVGEITVRQFLPVIFRELSTGLFLGIGLSALGFARAYIFNQDIGLSLTLGLSVALAVTVATLSGAVLPLLFRALHLDPALMSGPFITTLSDILGLFIYFEIAILLLGV